MFKKVTGKNTFSTTIFIFIIVIFIFASRNAPLLFHSITELFTIAIYLVIIAICWNCQEYIKNRYLLFIGLSYMSIIFINLFYFLSTPEFAIFSNSIERTAQSESIALLFESSFLLSGFLFIKGKKCFNPAVATIAFLLSGLVVLFLIYQFNFSLLKLLPRFIAPFMEPALYLIIIANLLTTLVVLLFVYKKLFNPLIFRLLVASICFKIAISVITFWAHNSSIQIETHGLFIYHFTKLISSYLIYKAVIEIGLRSPFSLIFRELKQNEEELNTINRALEIKANTDSLTGLYNHKYSFNRIGEEIERHRRYGSKTFSIIMFDIDHFKKINDTYGHLKGDDILISCAGLIVNNLRNIDISGRYGGEEFVVILPETELESCFIVADRIRTAIYKTNFKIPEKVTISGGVAEYNGNSTVEELIKEADGKLYRAKKNGRNQVVL